MMLCAKGEFVSYLFYFVEGDSVFSRGVLCWLKVFRGECHNLFNPVAIGE